MGEEYACAGRLWPATACMIMPILPLLCYSESTNIECEVAVNWLPSLSSNVA